MRQERIFVHFNALSSVPRGSGNMDGIIAFLIDFAQERGLDWERDEIGNVLIRKPASPDCVQKPGVILQGHMDIVCVSDGPYDFVHQGIVPVYEGDWISAKGTTLGGDNGIAVAYMMAVLEDETLSHPALECLFTVDEETGLFGADALRPDWLKGSYLINLDSEEEGRIVVSCAGGLRCQTRLPIQQTDVQGEVWSLTLSGLQGGHSGQDIAKHRVNAAGFMGRMLLELRDRLPFWLHDISGELQSNSIPALAKAVVVTTANESQVQAELSALALEWERLIADREPGVHIGFERQAGVWEGQALTDDCLDKLLFLLAESPNGVQRMSVQLANMVDSSLNLGVLSMDDQAVCLEYAIRSSLKEDKQWMYRQLDMLARYAGGQCIPGPAYPSWALKRDSLLQQVAMDCYAKRFGSSAELVAIHAGLECGIIGDRYPELDMISIGPEMHNVHSTAERLCISSALRCYDYLLDILNAL